MLGSVWAASCPPEHGPERNAAILDAVNARLFVPFVWCPVSTTRGDYRATFYVVDDVLRIGEPGDVFRVPVSHRLQQQIADLLGVHCPTTKLHDLAWGQAQVKIPPVMLVHSLADQLIMSKTARCYQGSRMIDALLASAGAQPGQLARNLGKTWANSPRLWNARKAKRSLPGMRPGASWGLNYGFHRDSGQLGQGWSTASTPDGGQVIQGVCAKDPPFHDDQHDDYSQLADFVSDQMELEHLPTGERAAVSLAKLSMDPELCWLASAEGQTPMRHPGVPCGTVYGEALAPPSCPVQWPPPRGPVTVASALRRVGPLALVGTAIGVAVATVAR